MKISARTANFNRCVAAVFRHCLSGQDAARRCPVRKCRRDGLCAGPIVRCGDHGLCLGRADASDTVSDELPVPVCYFHLTRQTRRRVDQAYATQIRAMVHAPDTTMVESTRTIAARRWRRLGGMDV